MSSRLVTATIEVMATRTRSLAQELPALAQPGEVRGVVGLLGVGGRGRRGAVTRDQQRGDGEAGGVDHQRLGRSDRRDQHAAGCRAEGAGQALDRTGQSR